MQIHPSRTDFQPTTSTETEILTEAQIKETRDNATLILNNVEPVGKSGIINRISFYTDGQIQGFRDRANNTQDPGQKRLFETIALIMAERNKEMGIK